MGDVSDRARNGGRKKTTKRASVKQKCLDPWFDTAMRGDIRLLRDMISIRADVNLRDEREWCWGNTGMHYASRHGKIEVVRYLLDAKAKVHCRNDFRYTPLLCATSNGQIVLAKYLIDLKADVNDRNSLGLTPLHYAASCNYIEFARYLIGAKASLNALSVEGEYPLHSPFKFGMRDKCLGMVRCLLEARSSLTSIDSKGWTALHYAAEGAHLETVKYLLQAGADIDARATDGKLAIDVQKGESGDGKDVLVDLEEGKSRRLILRILRRDVPRSLAMLESELVGAIRVISSCSVVNEEFFHGDIFSPSHSLNNLDDDNGGGSPDLDGAANPGNAPTTFGDGVPKPSRVVDLNALRKAHGMHLYRRHQRIFVAKKFSEEKQWREQ